MFSHAISDIIIKFHFLFPHMPRKSLTLFHTFSHMLRKFAHFFTHAAEKPNTIPHFFTHAAEKPNTIPHFFTHAAEICTLFHTCCGNLHTVPHASTPGTLSASLLYLRY